MQPSNRLYNYIRQHEGLTLYPYIDDYAGTPEVVEYSIGYGHQIQPGENYLFYGITKDKAEQLMKADATRAGKSVTLYVKRNLNQSQYDALTNLVYSIGAGNFKNSNVVKLINSHAPANKVKQAWKQTGVIYKGVVNANLQKIRNTEVDWYYNFDLTTAMIWTAAAAGLALLLTTDYERI